MTIRIFVIEWRYSSSRTRVIARNAKEAINKALYKERYSKWIGRLHDIESIRLESEA